MKESKPWHTIIVILWRLGTTVFLLGVLAAFLVAFPYPVLKPILLSAINSRIPGELQVGNMTWSLNSIMLQDITYSPAAKSAPILAKQISADYKLMEDFYPKFDHVHTLGLEVPVTYDSKLGFVVEGLPALEQTPSPATPSMDLPPLTITQTKIILATEYGAAELLINGQISFIQGVFSLKGNGKLGSKFLSLKGDLEVSGHPPTLSGLFTFHELIAPQLFTLPIQGDGKLETTTETLSFIGNFSNQSLGITFKTDIKHDIAEDTSQSKINFTIPNLKSALSASTTKIPNLPHIRGGMSGNANVTFKNNKMTGKARVKLRNISVKDTDYNAENISGTIRFNNLENFSTPRNQKIHIQKLDSFLPLQRVNVTFQHKGNGIFNIQKAEAGFEKGTLTTSPFNFESFDQGVTFTLYMRGVSAQYLASFSKLSDLNVTGLVDGEMVLEVKDRDFAIKKGGNLWVTSPSGTIKYRSDLSKNLPHTLEKLTGNENPMNLVLIALWNLHYTKLTISLDKKLNEELNATLHLKGKNPDAFSGHPFEFNINVSGETLRLIRETLASIE